MTASAPMVLKVLRRRSRCRCWPPTCTALDCCCGDGLNDDAPPDRLAGFRPSPPARDGSGFPCLTAEIGAVCHQFDLSHSPVSAVVAELVAKNTQERWRFVAGRSRIPSLREVFWLTLTKEAACSSATFHSSAKPGAQFRVISGDASGDALGMLRRVCTRRRTLMHHVMRNLRVALKVSAWITVLFSYGERF